MPTEAELIAAASHRLGLYGYLQTGHKPAPHHRVVIDVLADEAPGTKDLIIMPPGHAKTTWGTVLGVAHYLGRHPDHSVLILSESGPRSKELFSAIQEQLESPLFQRVFPEFRPDKARGWTKTALYSTAAPKTKPDPTLACAGVGGPVIGRRPHLIVIDDPTDEEIATSKARRDHQELWFKRTLMSRLTAEAKIVVIMTRWHEADLAGFLTDPELGLDWRLWSLPAIAEPALISPPHLFAEIYGGVKGRALWPEQYPLEVLADKKRTQGPAVFQCMYQGDPSDMGGALFKMENLAGYNRTWVDKLIEMRAAGRREALTVFQYWDLAFSTDVLKDPDYTVGLTIGLDRNGNMYVIDLVRGRWEADDTIAQMVAAAKKWNPTRIGIEQVGAQLAVVQMAKKKFIREYGKPIVKGVKVDRDKVHRAHLPHALTIPLPDGKPGPLRFDHRAPWWPTMRGEMLSFPNGAHDDIVDALSGVTALAQKRERRVLNRVRTG